MYGYVVVNKPELKIKEYDMYRSYYCGLCEELLSDYGINGQISISYDMTFLLVLLTGLYEPEAGVPALETVRQKKYFHLWHNMEYRQDLHSAIRLSGRNIWQM